MLRGTKTYYFLILFMVCGGVMVSGQTASASIPATVIGVQYEICPVMGGKPQENVAHLHEGKIYQFCCAACIEPFKKDAAKLIEKIVDPKEVELKILNKNGACPITGKPAKSDHFQLQGDKVVFFCEPTCKDQVAPGHDDHHGHDHGSHGHAH